MGAADVGVIKTIRNRRRVELNLLFELGQAVKRVGIRRPIQGGTMPRFVHADLVAPAFIGKCNAHGCPVDDQILVERMDHIANRVEANARGHDGILSLLDVIQEPLEALEALVYDIERVKKQGLMLFHRYQSNKKTVFYKH